MSATRRLALLLAALIVVALVAFGIAGRPGRVLQSGAGYRAPAVNPPADPNRPDLFEEPGVNQ